LTDIKLNSQPAVYFLGVAVSGGTLLPFTYEQFVELFVAYNHTIWPAQLVAYALAMVMLVGLAKGASRLVGAGLALMWLWTGVGYHWLHFTSINKAAWAFGALFVLQGVFLLLMSVATRRLRFGTGEGALGVLGWAFIGYATLVYPLLGWWTGHGYPQMPMFGVTPCPVTIFTFGLLLLAQPAVPRWVLVVPFAWSLIGGSAAFLLRVPQDWFLLFSGLAIIPIVMRDRRRRTASFA
jgi:hypothetical protein